MSVVPLGGRHVNHFWHLPNELQIQHATLLNLDAGRYHGGWGRVRNALKQINAVRSKPYTEEQIDKLPKWDDDRDFPVFTPGRGPVEALERQEVFFSHPVDLDLMLLCPTAARWRVTRRLVSATATVTLGAQRVGPCATPTCSGA